MTTEPPNPPAPGRQVNTNGGTGFIGGRHEHHYHSSDYSAGTAADASRQATSQGKVVGLPIAEWEPASLGVHASIIVHDETRHDDETLTPYLARGHDQQLRQVLEQAAAADRPTLVLVVGTSCSGKTRTLFEAVTAVLPDWTLTAPRNDTYLEEALVDGIPSKTVIWLDELQDRLPSTTSGIIAAKAMTELLQAEVGPIVVAGTLWPINHAAMTGRPDPGAATAGVGAIPGLLTHATVITVPDTFTDADLKHAAVDDPRLQKAIATASLADQPKHGRKITQVLAGGTQLLNRLYPPERTPPPDAFSIAARAVLHAASDLRRIGLPNPIPRWAIEDAAPGYLDPPDRRPLEQWLAFALDETTFAARHDDHLTGTHTHSHDLQGVPALTPHWISGPDGEAQEAYDLHDYLLQEHLRRCCDLPTRPSLWTTVVDAAESELLSHNSAICLASSALDRGLYEAAARLYIAGGALMPTDTGVIHFVPLFEEPSHDAPQVPAIDPALNVHPSCLFYALERVDPSHTLIRRWAAEGNFLAREEWVRKLARDGSESALAELELLASDGCLSAESELLELRAIKRDEDTLDQLWARARSGDFGARMMLHRAGFELRFRQVPGPMATTSTSRLIRDGASDMGELRRRARAGDDLARQALLGRMALDGSRRHFKLLLNEAERGKRLAQTLLVTYYFNLGAASEALYWTRKIAFNDETEVLYGVDELLEVLVEHDFQGALEDLRARATGGHGKAQETLARVLARRFDSGDQGAGTELMNRLLQGDAHARAWRTNALSRILDRLRCGKGADGYTVAHLGLSLQHDGDAIKMAEGEMSRLVHMGYEPATKRLLDHYEKRYGGGLALGGLDTQARPIDRCTWPS